MSPEVQQLAKWCAQNGCGGHFGAAFAELTPIQNDAGFRRYFRVGGTRPLMAVLSPPATENNRAFVSIAKFLASGGLRVPEVHASDFARGFLLLEDLGSDLMSQRVNSGNADGIYAEVLNILLLLQQCKPDPGIFPRYDRQTLLRELRLFDEWFVTAELGVVLNAEEEQLLLQVYEDLLGSALSQPQVVVHRDFHSRNLIYHGEKGFGLIDFQDALIGPLSYDPVSLLKDCYLRWEPARVEAWALDYARQARERGLLGADVADEEFLRWFDCMGLQRHLKVLGIFCRLNKRDGKPAYRRHLPRVLQYVLEVLAKYPQLQAFSAWFAERLLPEIRRQPWMREGAGAEA